MSKTCVQIATAASAKRRREHVRREHSRRRPSPPGVGSQRRTGPARVVAARRPDASGRRSAPVDARPPELLVRRGVHARSRAAPQPVSDAHSDGPQREHAAAVVRARVGRLADPGDGRGRAAPVAVNPLFVWYSQEARAYGLFVLCAALAMLCFLRAEHEPTRGRMALFALTGALALLSHYFAVFLLIPMVLWLLFGPGERRPQTRRAALGAVGVLVLVGLALLPLISAQGGHGTQWIGRWPLSERLQAIPQYYLTGYSGAPLGHGVELLVALVILAALAVGLRAMLATPRPAARPGTRAPAPPSHGQGEQRGEERGEERGEADRARARRAAPDRARGLRRGLPRAAQPGRGDDPAERPDRGRGDRAGQRSRGRGARGEHGAAVPADHHRRRPQPAPAAWKLAWCRPCPARRGGGPGDHHGRARLGAAGVLHPRSARARAGRQGYGERDRRDRICAADRHGGELARSRLSPARAPGHRRVDRVSLRLARPARGQRGGAARSRDHG